MNNFFILNHNAQRVSFNIPLRYDEREGPRRGAQDRFLATLSTRPMVAHYNTEGLLTIAILTGNRLVLDWATSRFWDLLSTPERGPGVLNL